ncbi:MAG: transcription termination factor Rho [Lachnospiraceae bacterium]
MDFENMSLAELKAYAKENNIKGVSALRKNELIEIFNERIINNQKKEKEGIKEEVKEEVKENKVVEAENRNNISQAPFEKKYTYERNNYEPYRNTRTYNNVNNSSMRTQRTVRPNDNQRNVPQRTQTGYQQRQNFSQQNGNSYTGQSRYNQDVVSYSSNPRYNQDVASYSSNPRYNQDNAQNIVNNRFNQDNVQNSVNNRYTQDNGQSVLNSGYAQENVCNSASGYGQDNGFQTYNQENNNERYVQDTGVSREGVLELVKTEGYGFIRCDNFLPGENDVYVSPAQIRKFNLKTGDMVKGNLKEKSSNDKFHGLAFVETINGEPPEVAQKRPKFEDLTPVFPHERIHFETKGCSPAMRLVDILSPVGKGQRGMIVSQPKAGKTTLLKQIANAITINNPEMEIIILLIDERPEEVTDIKESIVGNNVQVIYSTFDELPENHKRVSEMVIERAKRLVEHKKDVCILLDSITRLARAYNLTVTNSGRTLSGGLDPSALYMPKKFFGAARCMREGGSLTILATALVDTGSRMDDVVFEEFKGTGNMELVLDRSLSEKRIFPAIDLPKSGTRREDLLLSQEELEASYLMRNALNGAKSDEAIEAILNYLKRTVNNEELVNLIRARGIFAN